MRSCLNSQKGYFLILAIIFILVIGTMGLIIAHQFANRAQLSVAQQNGLNAFYIAESGLEVGARLLRVPSLSGTPARSTCGSLTGTSTITNAAMGSGTFTISTINSSPVFAIDTLSSAITATSTTINAASTAGFATSGRILIDSEAIDYTTVAGNSFIGVTRGAGGTLPAIHVSGAGIGQYVCSLDVKAGIPNLTSPQYQRELQWTVQLENGWVAGIALSGSAWNLAQWNFPTELQWTQSSPAIATTQQMNGVSMLSNADVWIVGNKVAAFHYNGTTWSNINTGMSGGDNLMAVSAVSSHEAWAAAAQGKVYKWAGASSWTTSVTQANALTSISMIDSTGSGTANAGWVVGAKKTAYFYNGSSWVSTNSGIAVDLNGVSTISPTEAWATGGSGDIYKWNGTSWISMSTPTTVTLNSISMMQSGNATIGWAVGASSALLYYDGTSWTLQSAGISGSLIFNSVVTLSPNEAWTVTSTGRIYKWNGSTWSLIFTSSKGLFGIDIARIKSDPESAWRQIFH